MQREIPVRRADEERLVADIIQAIMDTGGFTAKSPSGLVGFVVVHVWSLHHPPGN